MGKNGKGRGHDAKGRSKKQARFIQWPYSMMESDAFLGLSGGAVKTLAFLQKRFNGSNNGRIAFGTRSGCLRPGPDDKTTLVEVPFGLKQQATSDNLFELQAAGFIVCMRESLWTGTRGTKGQGIVREWRLTWLPCNGEPPTNDFAKRSGNFRRPKAPPKSDCRTAKPEYDPPNSPVQQYANGVEHPQTGPNSPPNRPNDHSHSPLDRTHLGNHPSELERESLVPACATDGGR